ncbi:hypothetical protein ABN763_01515 [Spongiivirga sp. MCCC 1A20706]|uniref:hypothetical protein n=1 Tax=Spongiivirga sp. MCCC 1A20706 TaxID=3160963 RepID=UPI00397795E4
MFIKKAVEINSFNSYSIKVDYIESLKIPPFMNISNLSFGKWLHYNTIIIGLIFTLPFLQYSYLFFSESKAKIDFLFFHFDVGYYENTQYFLWIFLMKFIPLMYLTIWYVDTFRKWRFLLLIPIAILLFKLLSIVLIDTEYLTNESIYVIHCLTLLFLLFLIYFGTKINKKRVSNLDVNTEHFIGFSDNIQSTYLLGLNEFRGIIEQVALSYDKKQIYNLIFLKTRLSKQVEANSSKHLKLGKSFYYKNVIIVFFIFLFTSLIYLYKIVPKGSEWQVLSLRISSQHYSDIVYFIWLITNKLAPLFFLILWLVVSTSWWKNVLIVPISFYMLQLVSLINPDVDFVDEYEIIQVFPLVVLIGILLVITSKKLRYYRLTKNLILEIEKEINHTLDQITNQEIAVRKQSFQDRLAALKAKKSTLTKDEYLLQMVKLRNEIE